MELETNEPDAEVRPGDHCSDPEEYSEQRVWEQELVARCGVTIHHARVLLNALRGEVY